jgi:predicted nucleic acid-binding protein
MIRSTRSVGLGAKEGMKILVDSSVLVHLIDSHARAPIDPTTDAPVAHCRERVESLLETLDAAQAQLVIPTPVLSELLIRADGRQVEILNLLKGRRAVEVRAFDEMAAVENAALRRSASERRGGTKKEVSFDLQILAIARTAGCASVLTDDQNLQRRCVAAGMKALGIADLGLHDSKRQIGIPFDEVDEVDDAEAEGAGED